MTASIKDRIHIYTYHFHTQKWKLWTWKRVKKNEWSLREMWDTNTHNENTRKGEKRTEKIFNQ